MEGSASTSNGVKKRRRNRGGKGPKDINAPKPPSSAYVLFLYDQRHLACEAHPELSNIDITKLVASQWRNLTAEEKQNYDDRYMADKKRFEEEFSKYRKTASYRQFQQKLKEFNKGDKSERKTVEVLEPAYNGLNIPIFSHEFVEHNKAREAELRRLRREVTQLEEENISLEIHVDKISTAVDRLAEQTSRQRETNMTVKRELTRIRQRLAKAFASVPLPGTKDVATVETIDDYIAQLQKIFDANLPENRDFISKGLQIVNSCRLD